MPKIDLTIKKIKTLAQMKDAVKKNMRKSYVRTAILDLIDNEHRKFKNPTDQSLTLRIEKDEWIRIQKCVNNQKNK